MDPSEGRANLRDRDAFYLRASGAFDITFLEKADYVVYMQGRQ